MLIFLMVKFTGAPSQSQDDQMVQNYEQFHKRWIEEDNAIEDDMLNDGLAMPKKSAPAKRLVDVEKMQQMAAWSI